MAERRPRNGRSAWFRVHRVLGITSALFVLLLAVTGIALNHTDALGLDERHADAAWLLDWYGIQGPGDVVSYPVDGHALTRMGDRLWFDGRPVLDDVAGFHGAVASGRFMFAALGDGIALFTRDGRLVERVGAEAGVPAGIERIGTLDDGRVAVATRGATLAADGALAHWRPAAAASVDWARRAEPPPAIREDLERAWRGQGVSVERLMLDLHSGRLLGAFGTWLMDAMALAFMALAVSGLWLWVRRRGNQRRARQNNSN